MITLHRDYYSIDGSVRDSEMMENFYQDICFVPDFAQNGYTSLAFTTVRGLLDFLNKTDKTYYEYNGEIVFIEHSEIKYFGTIKGDY